MPLILSALVIFQSTHPVWGATVGLLEYRSMGRSISIHAPRVGCDSQHYQRHSRIPRYFNPRTPCGVRLMYGSDSAPQFIFQSTHPVWGATIKSAILKGAYMDFNPRTPCGVRLRLKANDYYNVRISIHAPRVGCDAGILLRRREKKISIHAPRVGCD